ncbi:unnamed protein product [Protopolystoma xenopodis]|uniref:Uncharacterized protein n=1 Tax=Protopolystoma xenopodis TaxID=117903 RepID=A0A448XR31_9PLAT|nr:unnamed protein product [Protopolystoma xenopodis]
MKPRASSALIGIEVYYLKNSVNQNIPVKGNDSWPKEAMSSLVEVNLRIASSQTFTLTVSVKLKLSAAGPNGDLLFAFK